MLLNEIDDRLKTNNLISFVAKNFDFFIKFLYKTVELETNQKVYKINGHEIKDFKPYNDILDNTTPISFFTTNQGIKLILANGSEIEIFFQRDLIDFYLKINRLNSNGDYNYSSILFDPIDMKFNDFSTLFKDELNKVINKQEYFRSKGNKEIDFPFLKSFQKKFLIVDCEYKTIDKSSFRIDISSGFDVKLFGREKYEIEKIMPLNFTMFEFQTKFLLKVFDSIFKYFEKRNMFLESVSVSREIHLSFSTSKELHQKSKEYFKQQLQIYSGSFETIEKLYFELFHRLFSK